MDKNTCLTFIHTHKLYSTILSKHALFTFFSYTFYVHALYGKSINMREN